MRYAPNVAIAHLISATAIASSGGRRTRRREFDTALDAWTRPSPGVHYDLGLLYLFSPSVPGVRARTTRWRRRSRSSRRFKSMRGAKTPKGHGRRRRRAPQHGEGKQGELQMKSRPRPQRQPLRRPPRHRRRSACGLRAPQARRPRRSAARRAKSNPRARGRAKLRYEGGTAAMKRVVDVTGSLRRLRAWPLRARGRRTSRGQRPRSSSKACSRSARSRSSVACRSRSRRSTSARSSRS